MPGAKSQSLSQSLNTRSSLAMLLRTLYRIGLDYCILPPAEDFPEAVIFTKDQLVSLVERTGPETLISDIAKQVTQGALKPVAVIKSDIKPDESPGFISKAGLPDPEQLQVLRVDDSGAEVMCLHEALHPKGPDFPEWWEAPVPFAMYGMGKLHINRTAELMFGSDLKRLSDTDIPDKNEFLVALENSLSPCSVTFRRLEGDIFMLDDSTGDVMAAADIAWWAAIGRAWLAKLDREKCRYRRYEQINEAKLEGLRENNVVLPCEWEGELLGYLCVEKSGAKAQPQTKPKAKAAENSKARRRRETTR